jgi:hypothetical protein
VSAREPNVDGIAQRRIIASIRVKSASDFDSRLMSDAVIALLSPARLPVRIDKMSTCSADPSWWGVIEKLRLISAPNLPH